MDMNKKNLIANFLCPIQDVSNYHYRLKYYIYINCRYLFEYIYV
jgi:hypothetical protein